MKQLSTISLETFSYLWASEGDFTKQLVVFERLVPSLFFKTPNLYDCKQKFACGNQVVYFNTSDKVLWLPWRKAKASATGQILPIPEALSEHCRRHKKADSALS